MMHKEVGSITWRSELPATLKADGLILRQATAADVEPRLALGSHIEIAEMFGVSGDALRPLNRDGAARWVERLTEHSHAWAIESQGSLLGEIRLDNVNRHDRRASMAVGILDPEKLGKGLGTKAIKLLLGHAFNDLDFHRIGVRVLAYNVRAIRAYVTCGFAIEGREREAAFVNGVWHDDIIMGQLVHEFRLRENGS